MKKLHHVLYLLGFFLIFIQLFSCKKIADTIFKNPLAVIDGCNIKKIIQYDTPLSDPRTLTFSYNAHGQPVSVLNDQPGTAAPQIYFRYDAKKRLTDYLGIHDNGTAEFWYKYYYDHYNRVIRDTQWVFGAFGPMPDPSSYFIRVTTYTYDPFGRIASKTSHEIQPEITTPATSTYNYNGAGNLITGGAYDDKLSFRRTNKVWMFIEENYSLNNNPDNALSYNSKGLPLAFDSPTDFPFLGYAMRQSTIEYFCD